MNYAAFIIEGSAGGVSLPEDDLGYDGEHDETLSFRILPGVAGRVQTVRFLVQDADSSTSPQASDGAPELDLEGATTGQSVLAVTPTTDVTTDLPADGCHSWIVRCVIDGRIDHSDYVFERMVVIRSPEGNRKILSLETTQYEQGGWAEAVNDLVDNGAGGGGGDVTTTNRQIPVGTTTPDEVLGTDQLILFNESGIVVLQAGSGANTSGEIRAQGTYTSLSVCGGVTVKGTFGYDGATATLASVAGVPLGFQAEGGTFVRLPSTLGAAGQALTSDGTKLDWLSISGSGMLKARALAVANVASLSGTTTIDGVSLIADERVLLTAQSTPTQNGLWVIKAGSWVRPTDFAAGFNAAGAAVIVTEGTAPYADSLWVCTSNDGSAVVGTNNLVFGRETYGPATVAPADIGATAVLGVSPKFMREDASPKLGASCVDGTSVLLTAGVLSVNPALLGTITSPSGGSVTSGGGTRDWALPAAVSGITYTVDVQIETRVGSGPGTRDVYRGILTYFRDSSTTSVISFVPASLFTNPNYGVAVSITSHVPTVRMTNSTGTTVDNATCKFVRFEDTSP